MLRRPRASAILFVWSRDPSWANPGGPGCTDVTTITLTSPVNSPLNKKNECGECPLYYYQQALRTHRFCNYNIFQFCTPLVSVYQLHRHKTITISQIFLALILNEYKITLKLGRTNGGYLFNNEGDYFTCVTLQTTFHKRK